MIPSNFKIPLRSYIIPVLVWIVYFIKKSYGNDWLDLIALVALVICTLEAVHHAEVIAVKVGEPYGELILALAVTVIEVSMIISMMHAGGAEATTLARDTVFAAIMIILNGMIGISLFIGAVKYRIQTYVLQGVSSVTTVLLAISVLTLILPNYTSSASGSFYSNRQLIFVSAASLLLYSGFILVQGFWHKDHFVSKKPVDSTPVNFVRPDRKTSMISFVLLFVCLSAVILLAKSLAPALDRLIHYLDAPRALAGIAIACIILLPETLSSMKAARRDQLQTSLNLSLGSALATICLSIPAVAIYSIVYDVPLALGLDPKSTVLLILSLLVVILSFKTGKTTILPGIVLLVIFAAYIFMTLFP